MTAPCPGCDRPISRTLCATCEQQLQQCALAKPAATWRGSLPLFAWGRYEGKLRQAIAALKYHNHPQLADDLGNRMAKSWRTQSLSRNLCSPPIVVPVPLHPARAQERGYNQAALLARAFCQRIQLPLAEQGLSRCRATEAQFGLSASARQQNLAGAFQLCDRWQRHPPQRPVLLLDDIYTTGSTVQAAAQTLRSASISVIGTVVLARAIKAD
ncbi:MAG: ComF family protein [Cyanobacteria bacterium J06635_15]